MVDISYRIKTHYFTIKNCLKFRDFSRIFEISKITGFFKLSLPKLSNSMFFRTQGYMQPCSIQFL